MNKVCLIFSIGVLLPSVAVCQTLEEKMAATICTELSELDLKEETAILNQKAIAAMQKVYQDYQPKATKLVEDYRKKYPQKSDTELTKLIGQEVTVYLMDECTAYQRITMFGTQPVPKMSALAIKIGKEFTNLLSTRMQTESVSQELIDDCVMQVTTKYSDSVAKEYGDPYAPLFIKEFQAYLMTESMPYIRWMASQIK